MQSNSCGYTIIHINDSGKANGGIVCSGNEFDIRTDLKSYGLLGYCQIMLNDPPLEPMHF